MRILSFSKKWEKLSQAEFTTFRFPRKDRDWEMGEVVQVYFKSRSPQREQLGVAEIVDRELRELDPWFAELYKVKLVADYEAIADGFTGRDDMVAFMEKKYGLDYISFFNKLTLRWVPEER